MFEQPTVIITGAGSSMEFGLPSGKDIFQALRHEARNVDFNYFISSGNEKVPTSLDYLPTESFTFSNLINAVNAGSTLNLRSQILNINSTIDLQCDDSIDEYLFNNSSYNQIGKLLSIWRLYCSLYQTAFNQERREILSLRSSHMYSVDSMYGTSRSWIASLADKIKQGCLSVDDLKKNKLSILTFNYDSYIEEGLRSLLTASERFSELKDLDFIDIIHINGKLNLTPTFDMIWSHHDQKMIASKKPYLEIEENTKNIFMVNEVISEEIKASRTKAKELLAMSEKIFILGFAFDPNNVSTVGLSKLHPAQNLYALNYDGDIQLSNRIKSIGVNNNTIIGSTANKVGCREAALKGFFDQ